ncbi:response regulator transcription factor [bacterium]|nr:MAG: response regulator transcription factor [bacterium]
MKVLIVEDESGVSRFLAQACLEAGYAPQIEGDGTKGLAAAKAQQFDLILLDVMLPGMDGFEVCRQMRSAGVQSLVLIITARDTLEDKIQGLDAGADDYVCKPFRVAEILARMRALLRRKSSTSTALEVADLSLDPGTRMATRGGKLIHLSATEYALLEYLMRHVGKTMPRTTILDHVWQYDFNGNDNVLDVYIGYLRQKIDKGREPLIHTARGVGYRLGVL